MPLQATSGAASYDAFGGGVAAVPQYIEDVFSTWLTTGTSAAQTITNGIDLSGKGGLVWIKRRNGVDDNYLQDSTTNFVQYLSSNTTSAQSAGYLVSPTSTGYIDQTYYPSTTTYASWTFRKQPKFFDVVTYTGNGAVQTINHNLASVPGCIIVKRTDSAVNWGVYHRSVASGRLYLNTTDAIDNASIVYVSSTSTSFTFEAGGSSVNNANGATYVAYLFAHNAGGFGLTGTDNVISCGSYTGDGGTASTVINLGYEPQWILVKRTDASTPGGNWGIFDNMRGLCVEPTTANDAWLQPNTSAAESMTAALEPTATGFRTSNGSNYNASGGTYIYIAIRRGPMKVPTTGTSVFGLNARTGTSANATVTGGAGVTDLAIIKRRNSTTNWVWTPRLAGTGYLSSNATTAETAAGTTILQANPWDVMDGVKVGTTSNLTNESSGTFINYLIDRAPGFMDVVCYTGNGSTQTITHNLGVAPELIIAKNRGQAGNNWPVLFNFASTTMNYGFLNLTNSCPNDTYANAGVFSAAPTSTSMFLINSSSMNASGFGIVAYLFASCPGVSKVGSYTGTGATQVINCGFTAGARFVLIKATSTTGDWLVWDSARGIVAGNDPYLALNSTAAEVTNTDWVDTAATGFELSNAGGNLANSNGVSYVFLAIS